MNKLALLGPENTFHDIARKRFVPHYTPCFYENFDDIFKALSQGDVSKALIAINNSNSGSVGQNLDRIKKEGYQILEEFQLPIHLYLGSRFPNSLNSVAKIYSHPMAIKETQQYFRKYSHIKFIATSSTAGAIEEASKSSEKNVAVIASEEALHHHALLVISKNIEDEPDNATTFCLIKK